MPIPLPVGVLQGAAGAQVQNPLPQLPGDTGRPVKIAGAVPAGALGAAPANPSGIPHRLAKEAARTPSWVVSGYKERYSPGDSESTMVWIGPWSTRLAFRDWCLGDAIPFRPPQLQSVQSGTLSRVIPAQHPENPHLYAVSCDLLEEGAGAGNAWPVVVAQNSNGNPLPDAGGNFVNLPAYASIDNQPGGPQDGVARYAVRYADPGYEVRTDAELKSEPWNGNELYRWVKRDSTYALTGLPINKVMGQTLRFTAGPFINALVPEAGVQPIWTQNLVYTWYDVPSVPEDAIVSCLGKVNSLEFDDAGRAVVGHGPYPPGTLLCEVPTKRRHRLQNGRVVWEIVYHFNYRESGWNSFPAADGNYYPAGLSPAALVAAAGVVPGAAAAAQFLATTVYKPSDFNALFVCPVAVQWQ